MSGSGAGVRGFQFKNNYFECAAVPRWARFLSSHTCASLNSRRESNKEREREIRIGRSAQPTLARVLIPGLNSKPRTG